MFTKRRSLPASSQSRSLMPGCCFSSPVSSSSIVRASTVTSDWLAVSFCRGVGILTFTAMECLPFKGIDVGFDANGFADVVADGLLGLQAVAGDRDHARLIRRDHAFLDEFFGVTVKMPSVLARSLMPSMIS